MKMIRTIFPLMLSCLISLTPSARADDAAYAADRQKAMALAAENKRVEALPLLEKLAADKPTDDDVLVELAGSLINQASIFDQTDPEAAVKARLRARQLLLKAQELGNKRPIVATQLELIREDGRVEYSEKPLDRALRAAEAAFAKGEYDEAVKHYLQMLDLDPKNYSAALYIGDSYHMAKQYAKSADWYERAITIDPNRETAYRYYATILFDQGDSARGRIKLIQAVVAEPYTPRTWRTLLDWSEGGMAPHAADAMRIPEAGKASYAATRAAWKAGRFMKRFPREKKYRHSLPEEVEALSAAADAATAAAPSDDANLARLLKHKEAGMLEPYALLLAPDKDLAKDYAGYRKDNRIKLEKYLDAFVVPPAPPNNP